MATIWGYPKKEENEQDVNNCFSVWAFRLSVLGSPTHTSMGKASYWSQGGSFWFCTLVAHLSLWSQLCFTVKDKAQEGLSNRKAAQGSMMSDDSRKCRSGTISPCIWTLLFTLSFYFFVDTKYPRHVDWSQNGCDTTERSDSSSPKSPIRLCVAST